MTAPAAWSMRWMPDADEREPLTRPEPAQLPRHADGERLVRGLAGQHVHADARAVVVVEAGVARLPPGIQPGLRVRRPPEQARRSGARPVELVELDQRRRRTRQLGALVGLEGPSRLAEPCDRLLVCHAASLRGDEAFYDQDVATARRPTARDTVRALWLLGLREPVDVEEIRDGLEAARGPGAPRPPPRQQRGRNTADGRIQRRPGHLRALGGDRTALAGAGSPRACGCTTRRATRPSPPTTMTSPQLRRGACRRPRRSAANGAPDCDRATTCGRSTATTSGASRRVTASDTTGPVTVELEDGRTVDASTLELAAYGCPVCGLCAGPAVEHPGRRPCPDCLAALRRLEREPGVGRDRAERAADARPAGREDRGRAERSRRSARTRASASAGATECAGVRARSGAGRCSPPSPTVSPCGGTSASTEGQKRSPGPCRRSHSRCARQPGSIRSTSAQKGGWWFGSSRWQTSCTAT